MSIFEEISLAEAAGEGKVEVEGKNYLTLVDNWILCTMLVSAIEDGNNEAASEIIQDISARIMEYLDNNAE
jgi:hypothetical protein